MWPLTCISYKNASSHFITVFSTLGQGVTLIGSLSQIKKKLSLQKNCSGLHKNSDPRTNREIIFNCDYISYCQVQRIQVQYNWKPLLGSCLLYLLLPLHLPGPRGFLHQCKKSHLATLEPNLCYNVSDSSRFLFCFLLSSLGLFYVE